MRKPNMTRTLVAALILSLGFAPMLVAQTNWTGTTSSVWGLATNWSGGAIPTNTTPVVFDVGNTTRYIVEVTTAATAAAMTVNPGAWTFNGTGTNTLTVSSLNVNAADVTGNLSRLTVSGMTTLGGAGGEFSLTSTLSGGLTASGSWDLANLTVAGAGTTLNGGTGEMLNSRTNTLRVNTGTWDLTGTTVTDMTTLAGTGAGGNLTAGTLGGLDVTATGWTLTGTTAGAATLTGGGSFTGNNLTVTSLNATGNWAIDGGGSTITVLGDTVLSATGVGSLNNTITQGLTVNGGTWSMAGTTATALTLGNAGGSINSTTVLGPATMLVQGGNWVVTNVNPSASLSFAANAAGILRTNSAISTQVVNVATGGNWEISTASQTITTQSMNLAGTGGTFEGNGKVTVTNNLNYDASWLGRFSGITVLGSRTVNVATNQVLNRDLDLETGNWNFTGPGLLTVEGRLTLGRETGRLALNNAGITTNDMYVQSAATAGNNINWSLQGSGAIKVNDQLTFQYDAVYTKGGTLHIENTGGLTAARVDFQGGDWRLEGTQVPFRVTDSLHLREGAAANSLYIDPALVDPASTPSFNNIFVYGNWALTGGTINASGNLNLTHINTPRTLTLNNADGMIVGGNMNVNGGNWTLAGSSNIKVAGTMNFADAGGSLSVNNGGVDVVNMVVNGGDWTVNNSQRLGISDTLTLKNTAGNNKLSFNGTALNPIYYIPNMTVEGGNWDLSDGNRILEVGTVTFEGRRGTLTATNVALPIIGTTHGLIGHNMDFLANGDWTLEGTMAASSMDLRNGNGKITFDTTRRFDGGVMTHHGGHWTFEGTQELLLTHMNLSNNSGGTLTLDNNALAPPNPPPFNPLPQVPNTGITLENDLIVNQGIWTINGASRMHVLESLKINDGRSGTGELHLGPAGIRVDENMGIVMSRNLVQNFVVDGHYDIGRSVHINSPYGGDVTGTKYALVFQVNNDAIANPAYLTNTSLSPTINRVWAGHFDAGHGYDYYQGEYNEFRFVSDKRDPNNDYYGGNTIRPLGYYNAANDRLRNEFRMRADLKLTGDEWYNTTLSNRWEIFENKQLTIDIIAAGGEGNRRMTFSDVRAAVVNTNALDQDVKGGAFFIQSTNSGYVAGRDPIWPIIRNWNSDTSHRGTLEFLNNYAQEGGAVHSLQHFLVEGMTHYSGNLAAKEGGAIYMAGQGPGGYNVLRLNANYGDISFTDNQAGVIFDAAGEVDDTSNAWGSDIHLVKDIEVQVQGGNYIYIDSGITSETNQGGNSMAVNMDNSRFIRFGENSVSYLSHLGTTGGGVAINLGTMRVDGTAAGSRGAFYAYGSDEFIVNVLGTLAGGGIVGSGGGFVIKGTVTPDSVIYKTPAALDNNGNYPTNDKLVIGQLDLIGKVTLANATYKIDTDYMRSSIFGAPYKSSDLLFVQAITGNTVGSTGIMVLDITGDSDTVDKRTTLDITSFAAGQSTQNFVIAAAQNGIVDQADTVVTNDNVMDYFVIKAGGATLNGKDRRGASLLVESQLFSDASGGGLVGWENEKDLVLLTSDKANVYLYWNGTEGEEAVWHSDSTLDNWLLRGGAADMKAMKNTTYATAVDRMSFLSGDYVSFTTEPWSHVELQLDGNPTTGLVVSGMEINSGIYRFYSDTNQTLYGWMDSNGITAGGDAFVGVLPTAQLRIDGSANAGGDLTQVEFDINTAFDRGVELSNGVMVVLCRVESLGAYDDGNNTIDRSVARGVVTVTSGDATIHAKLANTCDPITGARIQDNQNHFEVLSGANLVFSFEDTAASFRIGGVHTQDQEYKGGALYIAAGASFSRDENSLDTRLEFVDNWALQGGAIHSDTSLTLQGNTLFSGNVAVNDGGAIYMSGNGARNTSGNPDAQDTLLFDVSERRNIVFDGNFSNSQAGAVSNSVFMNGYISLEFAGNGTILFNDPIASGTIGHNSMTTAKILPAGRAIGNGFAGTAQFMGVNVLNEANKPGGIVDLQSGTVRLAGDYDGTTFDAQFHIGGGGTAKFDLGEDARLAGQGLFTISRDSTYGYKIYGTLSPDSDVLWSKWDSDPAHTTDHFIVGENADAAKIGTLKFDGDMLLSGASLNVHLGNSMAGNEWERNDLVSATGKITVDLVNGKTIVNAFAVDTYDAGEFKILEGLTIVNTDDANITNINQMVYKYFGWDENARLTGDFEMRQSLGSTDYNELWITNFSAAACLKVFWTGQQTDQWDIDTTENWITKRDGTEITFQVNDYVIFDDSMATGVNVYDYNVALVDDMTVSQMDIVSGVYTFTSEAPANPSDPRNDFVIIGVAGAVAGSSTNGALNVKGGTANMGVATDFVGGTIMTGGRVNILHDEALGVYDHVDYIANDLAGYIDVQENATIGTVYDASGTGAVNEYTVTNRFNVANADPDTSTTLTFDIANGTTLTIDGVDVTTAAGDNDGGAMKIGANGALAFTGTGTLEFTNNVAVNGGAIYAAGDLALNGTTNFIDNSALDGNGGAIQAEGNVTIAGTTTFTGNSASDADPLDLNVTGSGGAISTFGTVDISGVTTFTDNHADLLGGAINANGIVTIVGNTDFIDNYAGVAGGAINTIGGVDTVVTGTTNFTNNQTGGGGGAVNTTGSVSLNGTTTFTNNQALSTNGGAINVSVNADSTITIAGTTTFQNNLAVNTLVPAGSGGAINTVGNVNINGTLTTFMGNQADQLGGAINANGTVTIAGTTNFTDNYAGVAGGAINSIGGVDTVVTGTTNFTNNQAGGGGGAINTAGNVSLNGTTTFTNNQALSTMGGAINVDDAGKTITTAGTTTFTNNQANAGGGAIYTIGNVSIGGTTNFTDNKSTTLHGGAINAAGIGKTITIAGTTTFENNSALHESGAGGAINSYGDINISGTTTFKGNTAGTNSVGGAINTIGAVTIAGTTLFEGNSAGVVGGAINSAGGVNTIIGGNTTFRANRANAGAAIFSSGNVTIGGEAHFLDNLATMGGAIYMNGGNPADATPVTTTLTLNADGEHIVFDGNTGNAIYTERLVDVVLNGDAKIFFAKYGTTNDSIRIGNGGTFNVAMDNPVVVNGVVTKTGGMAILNADADVTGNAIVTSGNLFLGADSTFTSTNFTVDTNGTLSGSGTVASAVTVKGTLDANSDVYTYVRATDTIELDTAQAIGELTFEGATHFDGATLLVDLGYLDEAETIKASDKYIINGTLTAGNANMVTLGSFAEGTYDIVDAGNTIDLADFYLDPDQATGARNVIDLQLKEDDNSILQIVATSTGSINGLLWTGNNNGTIDETWEHVWGDFQTTKMNWITEFSTDGERMYFLNDDAVIFADSVDYVVTKDVRVVVSGVRVSDMEVSGTGYTFNPNSDSTKITGRGNANVTGKTEADLMITAATGTTTFNVETDFDGKLDVSGGGSVVFNEVAKFNRVEIDSSNVTLNKANTITNGTSVSGTSTLTLGNDTALGASALMVNTGSQTTLTSLEDRTIANGITIANNGQLTINMVAEKTFTYGGAMTGAGNFVKDGAGTFKLTGSGDIGGTLSVNNGFLHLDGTARFEADHAVTIAANGTLMGTGTLVSTVGATVNGGTLSAGNAKGDIGILTLDGNLTLNDATLAVDVLATNWADKIDVINGGIVNFGATDSNANTVNVTSGWTAGSYEILVAAGGFSERDHDAILAHFKDGNKFRITDAGEEMDIRQNAVLKVVDSETDASQSLLLDISAIKNFKVYWTGDKGSDWDTAKNWREDSDTSSKSISFVNGDYVYFANTSTDPGTNAARKNVDINNGFTVSGMEILESDYKFYGGTNGGTITGIENDLGNGGLIINATGNVTFDNVTMAFKEGTQITGTGDLDIILRDNASLGTYGNNNEEGYIGIGTGRNVTIQVAGTAGSLTMQNKIVTEAGSTLKLNSNGKTLNVKDVNSNAKGGTITAAGNVTVEGTVNFTNNEGTQAGAIYMGPSTTLTLNGNIAFGDDTFTNRNMAGANANSVYLDDKAKLVVNGNGNVYFYDPIHGAGTGEFTKNGAGAVYMYGENTIGTDGTMTITDGTLWLKSRGDGSANGLSIGSGTFGLKTNAMLAGTGTLMATGGINLYGTLSPSDGDLTLIGNSVTFDSVSYNFDVDEKGKINVTGDVIFDTNTAKNWVELSKWASGTKEYVLIVASESMTGDSSDIENYWDTDISQGGERNYRRTATFSRKDVDLAGGGKEYQLILTTFGENADLIWNGRPGEMNWNGKIENQNWFNINKDDAFMDGDVVRFTGLGEGDVNVDVDGVITGGMKIEDGEYTFVGGKISGRKDSSSIETANGALDITGGDTTFIVKTEFDGGINISGVGTKVALGRDGQGATGGFKTTNFVLGSGATLDITPATGSIVADKIELNGTVTTTRAMRKTGKIADVIASSYGDLDETQLRGIFDVSYGLIEQEAAFHSSNTQDFMDVLYTRLTVGEFGEKNDFGHNEMEVAEALDDIFAGGGMDYLEELLYDTYTTSGEVAAAINILRGTEQAADALMLGLWKPWRAVYKQMDEEHCCGGQGGHRGWGDCPNKKHGSCCKGKSFWFEGYYRDLEADSDGNAREYSETRGGMMIGLDQRLGTSSLLGITFGYGNPRLKSQFGKVEADDFTLAFYGRTKTGSSSYLNGFIGFGGQNFEYERRGLLDDYVADYDGYTFYTSLEWVRPVKYDHVTFLPLLALDYQRAWTKGFTEEGNIAKNDAQKIEKANAEQFVFRAGVNTKIYTSSRTTLRTRLQYGYLLGGDTYGRINTSFVAAPGATMALRGVNLGRHQINAGIGGEWVVGKSRRLKFFGDYDYDYGKRTDAHTGEIGLTVAW